MELLPLVCLCLLTWSGTTFADGNETEIIRVSEGSDVTLPCSLSSRENIGLRRIEWMKDGQQEVLVYDSSPLSGQDPQFKDRVSYSGDGLRNGNASITIRDTKVADSGIYTCEITGHLISHIQLVVDGPLKDRRGENIPGAAPKPRIRTFTGTKDGVQLQCEVEGASPKPLVQFQDSSGNILPANEPQVSERGGRYDVILQTTVTKTGNYTCVATQEEINHQTFYETHVTVPDRREENNSVSESHTGKIVGGVLGAVLVVGLILFWFKRRNHTARHSNNNPPAETTVPLSNSNKSGL